MAFSRSVLLLLVLALVAVPESRAVVDHGREGQLRQSKRQFWPESIRSFFGFGTKATPEEEEPAAEEAEVEEDAAEDEPEADAVDTEDEAVEDETAEAQEKAEDKAEAAEKKAETKVEEKVDAKGKKAETKPKAAAKAKAAAKEAKVEEKKAADETPTAQATEEGEETSDATATKIAPFGKEDTATELQEHAAKTQDTLVDALENAEVAEIKRAVFRSLTRLRAASIKEFDTIARLETQSIDSYNDAHKYRAENPLSHLHEDEAPVETDKLKAFH
jgi:outer membrane biosynthesis protein TonB